MEWFSPRASTPASGCTRPRSSRSSRTASSRPTAPSARTPAPCGTAGPAPPRRFHGVSFDEKLDSAGRIRVPKPLLEHAGLEGECVVIGAGEYLEIWNAEAWAKQEEELDAAAPEIAEGLAG